MSDKTIAITEQLSGAAVVEIEDILADFDAEPAEEIPAIEEIEELATENIQVDAEIEAALAIEDAKGEAYSETVVEETAVASVPTEKVEKPRKARAAATAKPKAAPLVRDLSALPLKFFELEDGDDVDEDYRKAVLDRRPSQKKVAEKFDNLFIAMAHGKAPSTYVTDLFKILDAKKEVDSKTLIDGMMNLTTKVGTKSEKYNEGTARSQVGQIMQLFPLVGIATRDGNRLMINHNSTVAEYLRAIGA